MIKRSYYYWIFLLIIPAWSQITTTSVKNDITLHTFVESENVPQNREVVYNVELHWSGDLSLYKISEIGEPRVMNLIMRGSGSSNRVGTDDAGNPVSIKRVTYYFRPLEMGMAYVEGVTIKYEDTNSQRQESLLSSRIGIKIIDPLPEPGKNALGFLTWIGLLALVILIPFLYFYYRYQKRKQVETSRAALQQKETIEERYQRVLKETIHFTSTNLKDSLVDLSRLITGYFSERYNFPAMNLSTHNLLQVLKEKLNDDTYIRMQDFYERADMIKFAGEALSESEFHRLFDTVELVLEKQKESHSEEEER